MADGDRTKNTIKALTQLPQEQASIVFLLWAPLPQSSLNGKLLTHPWF